MPQSIDVPENIDENCSDMDSASTNNVSKCSVPTKEKKESLKRASKENHDGKPKSKKRNRNKCDPNLQELFNKQTEVLAQEQSEKHEQTLAHLTKKMESIENKIIDLTEIVEERCKTPQSTQICLLALSQAEDPSCLQPLSTSFEISQPLKNIVTTVIGEIMDQNYEHDMNLNDRPKVIKKFRPPTSHYRKVVATAGVKGEITLDNETLSPVSEAAADAVLSVEKVNLKNETLFEARAEEVLSDERPASSYIKESSSDLKAVLKPENLQNTKIVPISLDVRMSNFMAMNPWAARAISTDAPVKSYLSLKKMLCREGLISTFKCMGKSCSFTSICATVFKAHLEFHEQASLERNFLYCCPYCVFKGDSSENLLRHYFLHYQDKYQCGYCFYRAADKQTAWEHGNTYHRNKENKIYECSSEKTTVNMERLIRKRKEFVEPLTCTSKVVLFCFNFECSFIFITFK